MKTGSIDLERLKVDRDQLWAEATAREADGESNRLAPGLWNVANEQEQARQAVDPFVDVLRDKLGTVDGWMPKDVASTILGVSAKNRTPALESRLASALRTLGWQRKQGHRVLNGKRPWLYRRGDGKTYFFR